MKTRFCSVGWLIVSICDKALITKTSYTHSFPFDLFPPHPLLLQVRLSDAASKEGINANNFSIGVSNDRFDVVYDVANHAPRLRIGSHVNVRDKRIDLTLRSDLKANTRSIEAGIDVDDNNRAGVIYDLTNYDAPNYKSATVKWTYRSGDMEITPSYNLGSESLALAGSYVVDSENRLKATYDVNSQAASLQWVNSSGAGGGGDLRVTARANLNDAKQVPSMLIEKTWSVDA